MIIYIKVIFLLGGNRGFKKSIRLFALFYFYQTFPFTKRIYLLRELVA